MIILIIGGLVYMANFTGNAVSHIGLKHDVFSDDAYINNLNTVLKVTEPVSGRNMGTLLADAVYYRNGTLTFEENTINITNRTKVLLDMAIGEGNYYLVIKPRIIEVSMNFIIDGSNSLIRERKNLADNLIEILANVERTLNETNTGEELSDQPVLAKIYILGSKPEQCDIYNILNDSRISCQMLQSRDLYTANATSNASQIIINNTRFNLDSFLEYYNMTPPFGADWLLPTAGHDASEADYYESDWGHGTAYASYFDSTTNLARLSLLFPMGDELSTSSIADECFFTPSYGEWIVCSLCTMDCPVNRSLKSVAKAVEVANDNRHVINPIFSYSCDYDYKPIYNQMYEQETATSTTNACGESTCQGCTREPNGSVCFHPECQEDILSQMNIAANQTGGSVIHLENITQMDVDITATINHNIRQYTIEIGIRNGSRMRDVIESSHPLPNGQFVDMRLWVYKG